MFADKVSDGGDSDENNCAADDHPEALFRHMLPALLIGSLVEAAGIEPASEKAATSVPTGVAAVLPPSGRLSVAQPASFFASA
jgi:hypothetical protein